jgi:hypothetical protein
VKQGVEITIHGNHSSGGQPCPADGPVVQAHAFQVLWIDTSHSPLVVAAKAVVQGIGDLQHRQHSFGAVAAVAGVIED